MVDYIYYILWYYGSLVTVFGFYGRLVKTNFCLLPFMLQVRIVICHYKGFGTFFDELSLTHK